MYIFCEGNHCVDKLANIGIDNILDFQWFDSLLAIISLYFSSHKE